MNNTLLDFFFPITAVTPTPAPSTAFLKQALLVVKPKVGVTSGEFVEALSMSAVTALTANTEAQKLFDAGMSRVFVVAIDELDLDETLAAHGSKFGTILISSDFDKDDVIATKASIVKGNLTFTAKSSGFGGNEISVEFLTGGTAGSEVVTVTDKKVSVQIAGGVSTAAQIKSKIDASALAMALLDPVAIAPGQTGTAQAAFAEDNLENGDGLSLGGFSGVTAISSDDTTFLETQAGIENRVAFYADPDNGAKNMLFAMGKFLSDSSWKNQQFISMPEDDGVGLGQAESLFDKKISFVITDAQYGFRLGLLAAGGRAITAPYIIKNLTIDLQGVGLAYVSANQPDYTIVQATLIQDELQKVIDDRYIARQLVTSGTAKVTLVDSNWVGAADVQVPSPKALWRLIGTIVQTN